MTGEYEVRAERLKIEDVRLEDKGATYSGWAEALTIFAKYGDEAYSVRAGHEEVYAGPSHVNVTDEDLLRLAALGWTFDDSYDCFHRFT